jgi:hypothetical protein
LREYNTLKELYNVVWIARSGDLLLVTANPEPYGLDNGMSLDDLVSRLMQPLVLLRKVGVVLYVLNALNAS